MSASWIGRCLLQVSATGKPTLTARIIHVDMVTAMAFIVPFPRTKEGGRLDNYVPSPREISAVDLAKELGSPTGVRLVDFETPAHWLWTPEQIRGEVGDGSGRRYRRNLSSWSARLERAYGLIQPFVEGRSIKEIVMDPLLPPWPRERAKELGVRPLGVRRALNAYLFGLGNKRALLPWYVNCGAPGRQKFSIKDTGRPSIAARELGHKRARPSLSPDVRCILAMGWRRHMKKGVSVSVALAKTCNEYLAKSITLNSKGLHVQLKPEAHDITPAMFRYWGTRDDLALRPREIMRGETPTRSELERRMNKVKGRYETLNGLAYIDSTSTDQTLRSSIYPLKILKSPWRTEVLAASIDYIFGIYVGFEPVSATTALLAILSAATDKVSLCARFGHDIESRDWLSCSFNTFAADNGEGKGQLAMRTIEEMASTASYGKVYDAINKAPGESGHRQRQKRVDHLLPGSTLGRRKQRGEADRALTAGLRFDDYMHLLIKEILFHNNEAYIDPPRLEMYSGLKERTRRGVVEWLTEHHYESPRVS